MKKLLLQIVCILFVAYANGQFKKSGVIMQSVDAFDQKTGKYVPIFPGETGHRLFYYRDSLIIFPVHRFTFSDTVKNSMAGTDEIFYVLFIDLRTLSFYKYPTFSAKSKFTRKYMQADSMPIQNGWNFYSFAETQVFDSVHWITDTTINDIRYRRLQQNYDDENRKSDYTVQKRHHILQLLTSCAQKSSIFHILRSLEKRSKAECPFEISLDHIVSPQSTLKVEVKYVRPLTKKENAIFDAWERNTKLHPVSRSRTK